MKHLIAMLVVLFGVASFGFAAPPEFVQELKQLENTHRGSIERCARQVEEVLTPAVRRLDPEIERPNGDIQPDQFVADEEKAKQFLQALDVQSLLTSAYGKSEMELRLAYACKGISVEVFDQSSQDIKHCVSTNATARFFRALIFAMEDGQWGEVTRAQAENVVEDFLQEMSDPQHGALALIMAHIMLEKYLHATDAPAKLQKRANKAKVKTRKRFRNFSFAKGAGKKLEKAAQDGDLEKVCALNKQIWQSEQKAVKDASADLPKILSRLH